MLIPSQYININEVVQAIKKEKKRRKMPYAEVGGTGDKIIKTNRTSENGLVLDSSGAPLKEKF